MSKDALGDLSVPDFLKRCTLKGEVNPSEVLKAPLVLAKETPDKRGADIITILPRQGGAAAAAASDNLLASITPLAFEALLAQANKPEEELTPAIATSVMEIDRDVCRTMGDEIRDDSERQALRNVLVAWSVRNPMAGYAQGLNAIAAMLLGPALTRLPPVTTVVRDEAGEVVRVAGGADLWAFQILCHMLE